MKINLLLFLLIFCKFYVLSQVQSHNSKDTILAIQYIEKAQNLINENPKKLTLAEKALEIYNAFPNAPRGLQAKSLYAYSLFQTDGEQANEFALEVIEEAKEKLQTDRHYYLVEAYLTLINYQRDYKLNNLNALSLGLTIEPFVTVPSLNYFELKYHVGRCYNTQAIKEEIAKRIRDMESGFAQVNGKQYDKYKVLYHHLSMFYNFLYTDHYEKMVSHGEQAFHIIAENDFTSQNLIAIEMVRAYGYLEKPEDTKKWMDLLFKNEPKTKFRSKALEAKYYKKMADACYYVPYPELALKYSEKAINILKEEPETFAGTLMSVYFDKAQVLKEHFELDSAIATLKLALSIKDNLTAHFQLGMWLGALYDDQYEESLFHLQSALYGELDHLHWSNVLDNPPSHSYVAHPMKTSNILRWKAIILYKQYSTSPNLSEEEKIEILNSSKTAMERALKFREYGMQEFYGYEDNLFRYTKRTNIMFGNIRLALNGLYEMNPSEELFNEMFKYTEQRKVFQLIESLTPGQLPKEVVEREQGFIRDIQQLEQKLLMVEEDSIMHYKNELFKLNQQFEAHKSALRKEYPKEADNFYNIQYATPEKIEAALDKETLYLSYDVQYFGSRLKDWITMTAIGENIRKVINAPQDSILRHIWDLEKLNKNPLLIQKKNREEFIRICHQLYRILIEPFEEELIGIKKLVIVQEGHVLRVPFEILLKSNEIKPFHELDYFIYHFDISYQYSGTFYLQMKQKPSIKDDSFLAFAPVFANDDLPAVNTTRSTEFLIDSLYRGVKDNHFVPLPNTKTEVEEIARNFEEKEKVTILLEKEATKQNLINALKKPHQFVHIATHGLANFEEHRLSGLACYHGEASEEPLLFANEIQMQDIQADLVVLSSCESGAGKVIRGEGLISINRSFFYAGAKNVIFSLWKVSDRYTKTLMTQFYKEYHNGKSYGEALKAAKLSMLKNRLTASPNIWAPFMLIGE